MSTINSVTGRTRLQYNDAVLAEVTLGFTRSTQLRLTRVDGVGPVPSSLTDLENAADPGSYYIGSHTGNRNILLAVELGFSPVLGLMPGDDPSTAGVLRAELARVFTPGTEIELDFSTDLFGLVRIKGVVEKNDPDIFTAKPTNNISIICHDPMFYRVPNTLVNLPITFLTQGSLANVFYVDNPADIPVSFTFGGQMTVAGTLDIYHEASDILSRGRSGPVGLYNTYPLVNGDWFIFDTRKGKRRAGHERSAAYVNDMGYLIGSLVDAKLLPGRNWFRFNDKGRTNIPSLNMKAEIPIGGL